MIVIFGAVNDPEQLIARRRMLTAAVLPALAVLLLWSIFLVEHAYDLHLPRFGLLPRNLFGAIGIFTSPLIHGDLGHVFNNSIALFVLGWCLMYFYPKAAGRVVLGTWFIGGIMVWLTARPDHHIGASGIVYGLAAFLFFSGVIRRQRTLMAVSLLVIFLYGSLIWGVLPILPHISWESHLWGGVVGTALAWWLRGIAPAHMPKPIVFEEDEPTPGVMTDADPGDESEPRPLRPPPPAGNWPYDASTDITIH